MLSLFSIGFCLFFIGLSTETQAQLLVAPKEFRQALPSSITNDLNEGRIIKDIIVKGNLRSDLLSILNYLPFSIGDPINSAEFDQALKSLYATGTFSDVSVEEQKGNILITVTEHPIINIIAFEGNKVLKNEILEQEIQLRALQPLTKAKVKRDINHINSLYRQIGKLNSVVEAKIIKLDQNRVNLVFEIREGRKTTIEKLTFIGNEYYSDSDLRSKILSRQDRFWRIGSAKNYSSARINFDKELLRRFYINNGFADIEISDAIGELNPDWQSFNVTYLIRENTRYHLGDIRLTSKISGVDLKSIEKTIKKSPVKKGTLYGFDALRDLTVKITEQANRQGFPFADTRITLQRDQEQGSMAITILIEPQKRHYVERIDIFGNTITFDHVIRREMLLSEGDPLIQSRLNQSRRRIMRTGFFKKVDISITPGSTPARSVVTVNVTEGSTGTLNFSIGYSSIEKALIRFGFSEKNFRGTGKNIGVTLNLSSRSTTTQISITEPYFANRPIAGTIALFNTNIDNTDNDFEQNDRGLSLGMGYRLSENWSQRLSTRLTRRETNNIRDDAAIVVREQEGKVNIFELSQAVTYDRLNNRLFPNKGYLFSLSTAYSNPGSDIKYKRVTSRASLYVPLSEKTTWVIKTDLGAISSIGDSQLRISERFQIGGRLLKGFQHSGIGPRELNTDTALGGEYYATAITEFRFPLGLPQESGVNGFVFYNAGRLTGVDPLSRLGNYVDSMSVRDATGYGIAWRSPIGPFRLEWIQPRTREIYDKTTTFEFTIGTNF